MSEDYKVVIAFDFGTTFSGASYGFVHDPSEIYDIQDWPLKGGSYYPKVPTMSVYSKENPGQLIKWGHSAKKFMLKPQAAKENLLLCNFKLNLDETLQRGLAENLKSPVDNIADYLKELHKHVLEQVNRSFAKNYAPSTFQYCLTVPAMWSDRAKNYMRQAAVKAGLVNADDHQDRLVLISEPEAAALYCERMCDQVQLEQGHRMMICDAGGGTVDLITFEILSVNKKGGSRLKEITKGSGKSCGSTFLDLNFKRFIEKKLDHQVDKLTPSAWSQLMDQFVDHIKPEFDGEEDHILNLPASIDVDELDEIIEHELLDEHTLTLSGKELKEEVFDPIIHSVLDLIEKQYEQVPNNKLDCIFLVGGFGSSNYLYNCVQKAFKDRVKQILHPPRAELAVVRGAVEFGLNPKAVTSRVSRRTYGINAGLPFDESQDPATSRVVRPDGSVRCTSRFLTFVKKGDVIPVDQCIREHMYVYYGTIKETDVILYSTDGDTEPRHYTDPQVKQVTFISVPIPYIPNAVHNQRISYTIRMYFGLTEIKMEADFGDGNIHRVKCDFDAMNSDNDTGVAQVDQ